MANFPLVLLLLLLIAIILRLDFVYYVVYVLAGTYILARWWTRRILSGLEFRRRFPSHVFLGETVQVELEVRNTRLWPVLWLRCVEDPPLQLSDGSAVRQVITLGPRGRARLPYRLTGHRRGHYQIGPTLLQAGDLFGFAEQQGSFEQNDHLTVYPRVIPLNHVPLLSFSPHGTVRSRQQIFADPARIAGVRDYKPGDPLRSLDWKSSARAGTLLVKKTEPAVSLTTVVFLDFHRSSYSRSSRYMASEWAIVVAASLASYLVAQRQAVGLACNGSDPLSGAASWSIPARPGRTHLMRLLEWLARVELADTVPLAEWLPTATSGLAWGTTVVAVSPSGDEPVCRSLHCLARAGLNPVLVVVEAYADFAVVRDRARRLGIAAHMIAGEGDLNRWRAGRGFAGVQRG